jgi:hypothetical protein
MEKHDSDSGRSPSIGHEKGAYEGDIRHAEQVATLDRFPDPDEGKSEEEKALIVCTPYAMRPRYRAMADPDYRTRSLFAASTL